MTRMYCVALALAASIAHVAHADSLERAATATIERCFGKGFIPTPWGADERFAVKNLWVYGKVQRSDGSRSVESVWDLAGDGEYYFPSLPVKERSRSRCVATTDAAAKLGFAVSVKEGTTSSDRAALDAGLKALLERHNDLSVTTPSVSVHFVYGFDLDSSIIASKQRLNTALATRKELWGDSPTWRVVTAAIVVEPGTIRIKRSSGATLNLAGQEATLGQAGFDLSSAGSGEIALEIDEPAYIAYIAKVKRGSVAASSAPDTVPFPDAATTRPNDRSPWE